MVYCVIYIFYYAVISGILCFVLIIFMLSLIDFNSDELFVYKFFSDKKKICTSYLYFKRAYHNLMPLYDYDNAFSSV